MKKNTISILIFGIFLALSTGCSNQKELESSNDVRENKTINDNNMQIVVQGGGNKTVTFQLYDSIAAKSLYEQLPINIEVENYSDNEKIFYPAKKLDVGDTPLAKGPKGTLAYYEPWGDVVMFYGDCDGASGLYALGEAISGSEQIKELTGDIYIREVVKDTK